MTLPVYCPVDGRAVGNTATPAAAAAITGIALTIWAEGGCRLEVDGRFVVLEPPAALGGTVVAVGSPELKRFGAKQVEVRHAM